MIVNYQLQVKIKVKISMFLIFFTNLSLSLNFRLSLLFLSWFSKCIKKNAQLDKEMYEYGQLNYLFEI